MRRAKQKVIKQTVIKMTETLKRLTDYIYKYNHSGIERRQKVNKGAQDTAREIFRDFIKKFSKGKVRNASFRVTHSGLINTENDCCVKSVYNHILRLIEAGIVKKSKAVCDFGKGLITCIELKINDLILDIEVDEKFEDMPPEPAVILRLTDTKSRVRRTVSLGDLLNSLKTTG